MRKIQVTKERSELRRSSQACFHLLVLAHENICDLVLPGCADAFSYAEEHCMGARLNTQGTRVCSFWNILAFIFAFTTAGTMFGASNQSRGRKAGLTYGGRSFHRGRNFCVRR